MTRDGRRARTTPTDRAHGRRLRRPSRSRLRSHRTEHGRRCRHVDRRCATARAASIAQRLQRMRIRRRGPSTVLRDRTRDRDGRRDRRPLASIVCVVRARRGWPDHGHSDLCQALRRQGTRRVWCFSGPPSLSPALVVVVPAAKTGDRRRLGSHTTTGTRTTTTTRITTGRR
jgi:hypothetical protein